MNDIIKLNGLTFAVALEIDGEAGAPWDREDCHGPVSEWTARDKRPGERVLSVDRQLRRYYDVQGALAIAKRDSWGMSDEWDARYTASNNGIAPSDSTIRVAAVDADFKRLQDWCNDDWHYVGVVVTLLNTDGEETDESESLWGIESDADAYHDEVALDLAEQIAGRIGDAKELVRITKIRE